MIKRILTVFIALISINLVAQRSNSSPYSFFGIGEEFNPKTVEQAAMGGIGAAYAHTYRLNFINPAANSNLKVATYTIGGLSNNLTIEDNTGKQSANSSSLSYISLGFPIGKNSAFVAGLQPVSSVGYSFVNILDDNNDGITDQVTRFDGKGGASRIYGSFATKLHKNFSLGLELSYIFGNIDNSILSQVRNSDRFTKDKEVIQVRGGEVKIGALYEKELKNDLILNAGAAFKLGSDIKTSGNNYLYSLKFTNTGGEIPRDTLSSTSISEKIKNPLKTTLGVGLGKVNKWFAGIDYEFQKAFDNTNLTTSGNNGYAYGDSNRFSIGGFYLPKVNSISSYWNRVTYRAGLKFEKTGLLVNNTGVANNFTEIKDFGMSFGLSLPLSSQLSNINLGVEYGKRGTLKNNLIKENYFNFRISLSLNAVGNLSWFQKRKID